MVTTLEDIPYGELKKAHYNIENKDQELIDDLYYAAFVQRGLMPKESHFKQLKYPYFVYYNPSQIIGGDFFWVGKKDDWDLFAVGDCTGNGVSGAMLSTLVIGLLNYLVFSKALNNVGDIISELDKKWLETFNKAEDTENLNNDWLEISLIAFNKKTRQLQFAGATSSILTINDGEIQKFSGNPFHVGGWQNETKKVFTTQNIDLKPNTKLYLYSDGYKNQFGGINNKPLGSNSFAKLLLSISKFNLASQREELEENFLMWKGDIKQTDDVCIVALEF
jgi:serine phosphatase RsbU (regulator of sigma subunit)